jgi:hypothetical protein
VQAGGRRAHVDLTTLEEEDEADHRGEEGPNVDLATVTGEMGTLVGKKYCCALPYEQSAIVKENGRERGEGGGGSPNLHCWRGRRRRRRRR